MPDADRGSRAPDEGPGDETLGLLWHLPGFELGDRLVEAVDAESTAGGVRDEHESRAVTGRLIRAPRLSDREASEIAATVRSAALEARAERTHAEVLRAVSNAAMRLSDPSDVAGLEAERLLSAGLGWLPETAREALAGMAREWTEEALRGLVVAEIGDPALLDQFLPDPTRPGRHRTAAGPPLVLQIHAGNVPGVPVTGAVLALIARSGVLAKTGTDEPGLLPLFARTLAEIDPLLGRCVAATWWPGGERPPAFDRWKKEAGKAVVYGGDLAVQAVRRSLPPDVELIVYGPRMGIAVFLPGAAAEAARLLARDVCAYEQRGCVSPRVVFAIGADPLDLSDQIASGMAGESARVPPPALSEAEAVALRSARAECEFAGLEDGSTRVSGPPDLSWSVLAHREAGVDSEALPRAVWVYGVPSLDTLGALLRPFEGRIQSIGYAGHEQEDDLVRLAARLGVSRVCAIGEIAWPPADWRHDGRHRLLPLLTWTDWEPAS